MKNAEEQAKPFECHPDESLGREEEFTYYGGGGGQVVVVDWSGVCSAMTCRAL